LNVETPQGLQRVEFSAAHGNGEQKIYIVDKLDFGVVFTGGDYNSGGLPPNKIMSTVILPALLALVEPTAPSAPNMESTAKR
jgi:hypothetical protein